MSRSVGICGFTGFAAGPKEIACREWCWFRRGARPDTGRMPTLLERSARLNQRHSCLSLMRPSLRASPICHHRLWSPGLDRPDASCPKIDSYPYYKTSPKGWGLDPSQAGKAGNTRRVAAKQALPSSFHPHDERVSPLRDFFALHPPRSFPADKWVACPAKRFKNRLRPIPAPVSGRVHHEGHCR